METSITSKKSYYSLLMEMIPEIENAVLYQMVDRALRGMLTREYKLIVRSLKEDGRLCPRCGVHSCAIIDGKEVCPSGHKWKLT